MHLSPVPRFVSFCRGNSPALREFAITANTICKSRAYCALPGLGRSSRQSSPVQRRQVLTTTSLSLLPSWLPFSTMSAKAEFELPGEKWWSTDTVAVVTGANKGIGYGIAKLLASQGLLTVVAARNEELGRKAVHEIQESTGSKAVHFARLDITDGASVKHFAATMEAEYGGVTILVNNAGFAYKGDVFGADEADKTISVNYRGTRAVCEAVQPLLTKNARIVNVSSRAGLLKIIQSDSLRQKVDSASSLQNVDDLAEDFVASIKADKLQGSGWPRSMYGVSKLCETAYTRVLAEQLKGAGVMVNACCPGYVDTDMTSHRGVKTLEQGADTPVWLALMPPGGPTGKLFAERKQIPF
ncbi:hypothetical protein ABBQ38_000327 [Trebouxia sp. C0009 RCD-2024]